MHTHNLTIFLLIIVASVSRADNCRGKDGTVGFCLIKFSCDRQGLTLEKNKKCKNNTGCCPGFKASTCKAFGASGFCTSKKLCKKVRGRSARSTCGGPASIVGCCVIDPAPSKKKRKCIAKRGIGKCQVRKRCKSSKKRKRVFDGTACTGKHKGKPLGCCIKG